MIDDFLSLGKIVGTHGLQGGLKIQMDRGVLYQLPPNTSVQFSPHVNSKTYSIQSVSKQKTYILKLQELTSIEDAEKYVGKNLYILKDNLPPLSEGEFYEYQLLGLKPIEDGTLIQGYRITSILENPAHPILEFSNDENSILIPYIDHYIGKINIQDKQIEVLGWKDWLDAI